MALNSSSEESDHDREKKRKGLKKAGAGILPSTSVILATGQEDFNDFFWDLVVKYASAAMIALTVLDLLSSIRGDTVQCYTPSNYSRDQGAFVNSYCSQFTPPTDYFPFFLVGQASAIFGLHFIWHSWFSGKFRYFLALATSLERHRDSNTGDYSLDNFVISRALLDAFGSSRRIYLSYMIKLCLQVAVSGLSISFNFGDEIFGLYNASFVCPPNEIEIPMSWPIDQYRVPCVLTALVLLVAVRWLNVVLLSGIILAVLYGLVWCLWHHKSRLNWVMVAKFSFHSGMPPYSYEAKSFLRRYCSRRYCCKYRIKSDFDFLFLKVYREDAGHSKVLREVLIDDCIKKEEKRNLERLSLHKKDPSAALKLKPTNSNVRKRKRATIHYVKKAGGARSDQNDTTADFLGSVLEQLDLHPVYALDIAFGTSGLKLQLATRAESVVGIDLNPYYENEEDLFTVNEYAAKIVSIRTLAAIFSEDKKKIHKLKEELKTKTHIEEDGEEHRINAVVVGPIPASDPTSGKQSMHLASRKASRSRTIAVQSLLKWLREERQLEPNSYLITLRPVAIEGKQSISKEFVDFVPNWIPHVPPGPVKVYGSRDGWNNISRCCVSAVGSDEGPVRLRCGRSYCDYNINVYKIPVLTGPQEM